MVTEVSSKSFILPWLVLIILVSLGMYIWAVRAERVPNYLGLPFVSSNYNTFPTREVRFINCHGSGCASEVLPPFRNQSPIKK